MVSITGQLTNSFILLNITNLYKKETIIQNKIKKYILKKKLDCCHLEEREALKENVKIMNEGPKSPVPTKTGEKRKGKPN